MPRLLLFAPCQKVIIDRDDLSITLVSVFPGLTAEIPAKEVGKIPTSAVTPADWAMAIIWLRLPGEADRTFEQKVDIVAPDGQHISGGTLVFKMTQRTHNVSVRAQGMPIGQAGEYELELYVREVGVTEEWQKVAEYPIEIKHSIQQAASVVDKAQEPGTE